MQDSQAEVEHGAAQEEAVVGLLLEVEEHQEAEVVLEEIAVAVVDSLALVASLVVAEPQEEEVAVDIRCGKNEYEALAQALGALWDRSGVYGVFARWQTMERERQVRLAQVARRNFSIFTKCC